MLSFFRYALAALFLAIILISCSGKEEEEPTIDRFVLLKIGLEWEKEQWRKEGIKEADFKQAKTKNPKFELVLADGIGKGPMCSIVKKYKIPEEECLGIFRARARKVEFLIIEFSTVKRARDLARKLDGFYKANFLFDEVRGEPVLESWITGILEAKPGRESTKKK